MALEAVESSTLTPCVTKINQPINFTRKQVYRVAVLVAGRVLVLVAEGQVVQTVPQHRLEDRVQPRYQSAFHHALLDLHEDVSLSRKGQILRFRGQKNIFKRARLSFLLYVWNKFFWVQQNFEGHSPECPPLATGLTKDRTKLVQLCPHPKCPLLRLTAKLTMTATQVILPSFLLRASGNVKAKNKQHNRIMTSHHVTSRSSWICFYNRESHVHWNKGI